MRSEEKSANLGETAMDKRKVKPPGGAERASGDQQQSDGVELDDEWQVVLEEELQVISTCKCKVGKVLLVLWHSECFCVGNQL